MLSALLISVAPVIGALSLGLFAAAVGLRDLIADLIAGAWFARRPPFSPGDHIRVASGRGIDVGHGAGATTSRADGAAGDPGPAIIEGRVARMDWAHTTLEDSRGARALVPNRVFLGSIVRNFGPAGRAVLVEARVMISPDVSLDRAMKSVAGAAETAMEEGAWLTAAGAESEGPPAPRVIVEAVGGAGSAVLILLPARDFAAAEELRHVFLLALHRRLKTDRIGLANEEPGMPTRAIKVAASNAG